MGWLDDISTTVGGWFGGGGGDTLQLPPQDRQYLAPPEGFADMGSELGGTLSDWANAGTGGEGSGGLNFLGGLVAGPGAGFDFQAGVDQWAQALPAIGDLFGIGPTPGAGGDVYGPPPLDTSIPITLNGGSMDSLALDASGFGPYVYPAACRRPWRSSMAVLTAASRFMRVMPGLFPVVLGALAQSSGVAPGQLLFRFLAKKGRRHGSRGITGRQLNTTRKTLRKLHSMQRYLGAYRSGGHHRARCAHRGRKH